jgi:hypothetical protein
MLENAQRQAMPLSSLGLLATLLKCSLEEIAISLRLCPCRIWHGYEIETLSRGAELGRNHSHIDHIEVLCICKDQWANLGIIHQSNNMQGKVDDQLT